MDCVLETSVKLIRDNESLEYKLMRSQRKKKDGKSAYSILCLSFQDGQLADKSFIYDFTSEAETAGRIVSELALGGVSPITAEDVITDLLE